MGIKFSKKYKITEEEKIKEEQIINEFLDKFIYKLKLNNININIPHEFNFEYYYDWNIEDYPGIIKPIEKSIINFYKPAQHLYILNLKLKCRNNVLKIFLQIIDKEYVMEYIKNKYDYYLDYINKLLDDNAISEYDKIIIYEEFMKKQKQTSEQKEIPIAEVINE